MQGFAPLKLVTLGIAIGSISTIALGFTQGGWLLGSSAERLANYRSLAAVTEVLVPICVSQSRADPDENLKLKELSQLDTSYGRQLFVMEAGWATMPLSLTPNAEVAGACASVLEAEQG
jgi:hypothetical protein